MPLTTTSVSDLRVAGCTLASDPVIFIALMQATNLDPCTSGCVYYNGGQCTAYKKFHSVPVERRKNEEAAKVNRETSGGLVGGKWAGMTSHQIQVKEGNITRKEFLLRKQRGDYKE